MNEIFKREWELYQQAGSRPAFRGVRPKPGTTTFDAPVKVGEIRIFADMNRPFVALVLETKDAFGYRLVPVSPFTVPSSSRELLVGERVYQLWNACTAAKTFVERSWIVETLDAADAADLKEMLSKIPSGVQSEDETSREFRTTQATDGSWGTNAVEDTAWVVLSYLAHGETPSPPREFGLAVYRGARFLIDQVKAGKVADRSLPIVAFALAETYAMTRNPTALESADAALLRLEKLPDGDPFAALLRYEAIRSYQQARRTPLESLGREMERLAQGWRRDFPTGDAAVFACLGLMLEDGVTNSLSAAALRSMRGWLPGERTAEVEWAVAQCKYFAGVREGALPEDVRAWQQWNEAMKASFARDLSKAGDLCTKCLMLLQRMVYYRYLYSTSASRLHRPTSDKKTRTPEVQVDVDI